MSIKETISEMILRNGREILQKDHRTELIGMLMAENAYQPEMQGFLLCLDSIEPAALQNDTEITLPEYQNLLRGCLKRSGLQYTVCVQHLSLLLELLGIRTGNVSEAAKDILPEAEEPAGETCYTAEDIELLLEKAQRVRSEFNAAASIYADLMRADVTEAFYQYGDMTVSLDDDNMRKKGEQSLRTAAARGHIPAALRLGDYYMSVGNFQEAQRYYCGFGGAVLNDERRNNVYILDLMRRSGLRMVAAALLYAVIGTIAALITAFLLHAKGLPLLLTAVFSAGMLICAGLAGRRFLREPLFRARMLFLGEIGCFLGAVFCAAAGMDVTL